MTGPIAGNPPARSSSRWAGVFRALEHRHDPTYGSVAVAVCGAAVKLIDPAIAVERCVACFPPRWPS